MMNTIVVARSVAFGSGVIRCGRIPQPVVVHSRRFYLNICRSNRATGQKTVKNTNDATQSVLRMQRLDHAMCLRRMNTLQRPTNTQPIPNTKPTASDENPFNMRSSAASEDFLPPITLDNTIRMKNAAMATTLAAFCFGIAYYSMYAVGQSGTTSTSTNDSSDPLAVLKAEAAMAQEKFDKEQEDTANTADMLQKFQMGEFDPDHVSDEELDDLIDPKKKRPWWKFW